MVSQTDIAGQPLVPDAHPWVMRTIERFKSSYVGRHGLIVTELDGETGRISDADPLVPDFGDILPFLARFGETDFALDQVERAKSVLSNGLYRSSDGRLRLFDNHDWLLGLIELHELTGATEFLEAAISGADTVTRNFVRGGLLIDELPLLKRPKTFLQRSSAFNLGYVELLVDLYILTEDPRFLDSAFKFSFAFLDTEYFRLHGVFGTVFCTWSGRMNELSARAARMRSLLFKDNTNAVWSLLALYKATQNTTIATAIDRWIYGFEAAFWNGGDVYLWRGHDCAHEVSLKAAFASLDLLCDLNLAGFTDSTVRLARSIGDRWIEHQWENGLFPLHPGGAVDHIDCQTDMVVALMKLSGLTGERRYAESAARCARATVAYHEGEFGMILGVDERGGAVDRRIIVKYQSLALKLALLPEDPDALITDPVLMKLLRDR